MSTTPVTVAAALAFTLFYPSLDDTLAMAGVVGSMLVGWLVGWLVARR